MATLLTIIGIVALFSLLVLLYALCKVSSDADMQAGYMEEYANDFDEIDEDADM